MIPEQPSRIDRECWHKTIRKLNAHESQRCHMNPKVKRKRDAAMRPPKLLRESSLDGSVSSESSSTTTSPKESIKSAASKCADRSPQIGSIRTAIIGSENAIAAVTTALETAQKQIPATLLRSAIQLWLEREERARPTDGGGSSVGVPSA